MAHPYTVDITTTPPSAGARAARVSVLLGSFKVDSLSSIAKRIDLIQYLALSLSIERRGRFIQYQDGWIQIKSARQPETLALAT